MLGHAGRSRFNGVLAAARQAFAGVQQVFGGYSAGGAKRSSKGAAKTRRMCRECPAESTPAMRARPLVRRARGACRCGALRHAGRVAPAQPAACAGK
ncbi:hypothetical protein AQ731_05800 [Burkholderia pseudomallei]|nr:hypothetical protein BFR05_10820 [Burkholderia pseudomallei]EMP76984.1 hypothetical protein D512_08748 [Burkholderia pseudomallei MSHR1043]APF98301.1 hypothetical protein BFR06_10825 [Burkholderia pseudomallei]ARK98700.1 hypothetical protein BOC43_31655 [Burkholderia pseudomallei]AUG21368.1 hypothetical protein CXQ84_12700 [Burkholderia pseudomallei]